MFPSANLSRFGNDFPIISHVVNCRLGSFIISQKVKLKFQILYIYTMVVVNFPNKQQIEHEFKTSSYTQSIDFTQLYKRFKLSAPNEQSAHIHSYIIKYYCDRCVVIDKQQQYVLSWFTNLAVQLINNKLPKLLDGLTHIKFIQVEHNTDFDFPFTINNCIILPQSTISKFVGQFNQLSLQQQQISYQVRNLHRPITQISHINKSVNTIIHELIHIIQRYPNQCIRQNQVFNVIYTQLWGFKGIRRQQILWSNPERRFPLVSNPDGFNFQWIIPLFDYQQQVFQWVMPVLTLNPTTNKPIGILVKLHFNSADNTYTILPIWEYIDKVKQYTDKFYGLHSQLYHPNEILAHLIANYIVYDTKLISFSSSSSKLFYSMLQTHLSSPSVMSSIDLNLTYPYSLHPRT